MKIIYALALCVILLAGVSFAAVYNPPGVNQEKTSIWKSMFKAGNGITGAAIAGKKFSYYNSVGFSVRETPSNGYGQYYFVSQSKPGQTAAQYRPIKRRCTFFGCR